MDEIYTLDRIIAQKGKSCKLDTIVNLIQKIYGGHRFPKDRVLEYINFQKTQQSILKELKTLPVVEQRSMAWYTMRENMVTASDMGQALGHGKFGNVKDFYKKKCCYENGCNENNSINFNSPPLKWGVMYEPVATYLYSKRHHVTVHEFGLLKHPMLPFFGASPDGISDLGVMLEIKCPYKREIDGAVPKQYYYQIQGQLDVCNLEYCDYLECKFSEYYQENDFWMDWDKSETLTQDFKEKGIIIEYIDNDMNSKPKYIYSDVYLSKDKIHEWYFQTVNDLMNRGLEHYIKFWKLELCNVQRIKRDKEFFSREITLLETVLNQVQQFRGDKMAYDVFIKAKTPRKSTNTTKATPLPFLFDLQTEDMIQD